MHFLITGHTGFKGAWLSLLLVERGHQVSGLALDPLPDSLFEKAGLARDFVHDIRVDIRDALGVRESFERVQPEVVIHLAAQPLVRESYRNPRFTFETNVTGTLNILEASQSTSSVLAQLMITTDKVYRNTGQLAGYVESDALGGHDPYSSSKAMADLLIDSWTRSFPCAPTAIARAGNVIGGGDVGAERLLPDLISAFSQGEPAVLRFPKATRPWQHVLDCLNGYTVLIDALLADHGRGAWNIGPDMSQSLAVQEVAELVASHWSQPTKWVASEESHPTEAAVLSLDTGKITDELGWRPRLDTTDAVGWTAAWYSMAEQFGSRDACIEQIAAFESLPPLPRIPRD